MIDSVHDSEVIQSELEELVHLIRRDEQFAAVKAHGALIPLDPTSDQSHQHSIRRINELSKKYGIINI